MEGTWDMKSRCFTIHAPLAIAESCIRFQGVDGVHVLRFTSYGCSGFHVGWEDLDYPVDREEFLIEKEFWNRKRLCPTPTEHSFPRCCGFTDYYNPARPGHLKSGWVPLRPRSLSPRKICQSHPAFCNRPHGMSMFPENSANQSSCSPFCFPSSSPTCSCRVSFSELLVSPPQSPSEHPGDRTSPSNLCCWAGSGQHLL